MTTASRMRGAGTYIVAEAGSNHDGDLGAALELVAMAAEAGADAIKFQLFEARRLYPRTVGVVDTPSGPEEFYTLLEALEFDRSWWSHLQRHSRDSEVDLLGTPFDADSADFLSRSKVPAIKIASAELTHLPLLEHVARLGIPLFLSTGMATLGDIEEAISTIRGVDGTSDVTVLQCTTAYPAPEEEANLRVIPMLGYAFGVRAGLSDHTRDAVAAPCVAAALGAFVIEKHVTLSRSREGPDHPFAIEPKELNSLVQIVRDIEQVPTDERLEAAIAHLSRRRVEELLGDRVKTVAPSEANLAQCDRRALHAVKPVEPGDRVSLENVAILRGERNLRPGLHPRWLPAVLGAVVQRPIREGDGLVWADLLTRSSSTSDS